MSRKTVWDLGIELGNANVTSALPKQSLVFAGTKKSGKTSIIHRFLDRKEEAKPTLALDYTFGQSERPEHGCRFCDIWELGEADYLLDLLPFVIKKDQLRSMVLVLVLDLSQPHELVTLTERLLKVITDRLSYNIEKGQSQNRKGQPSIKGGLKKIPNSSSETFPILVIANKYDLFKEMQPADGQLITKYLCSLSQSRGCSLIYSSVKRDQLVNRVKLVLNQYAYGYSSELPEARVELTKPIWMPRESDLSGLLNSQSLESLRGQMVKHWEPIEIDSGLLEDPTHEENFKERDIDLIRSHRFEEMKKLTETIKSGSQVN